MDVLYQKFFSIFISLYKNYGNANVQYISVEIHAVQAIIVCIKSGFGRKTVKLQLPGHQLR